MLYIAYDNKRTPGNYLMSSIMCLSSSNPVFRRKNYISLLEFPIDSLF